MTYKIVIVSIAPEVYCTPSVFGTNLHVSRCRKKKRKDTAREKKNAYVRVVCVCVCVIHGDERQTRAGRRRGTRSIIVSVSSYRVPPMLQVYNDNTRGGRNFSVFDTCLHGRRHRNGSCDNKSSDVLHLVCTASDRPFFFDVG